MTGPRTIGGDRRLESAPLHGPVADLLAQRIADGYEILQQGVIARPYTPGAGMTFADQVDDCQVAQIRSGDVLLDDAERWVHLRRPR